MHILVITTQLFGEPGNGGQLCTARLLHGLLAAGHELTVLGRGPQPRASRSGLRYVSLGPAVGAFDALPRAAQVLSLAGAWITQRASTVHRLSQDGAPQQLARLLGQGGLAPADACVIDHLQPWAWWANAARSLRTTLPAPLLVMHNLESDGYVARAQAAAETGQRLSQLVYAREARLLRHLETQALRACAAVACLSAQDALRLRGLAAAAGASPPVLVLPGYPRLDSPVSAGMQLAGTHRPGTRAPGPIRIGLVGTWTWGPNRQALDWMLNAVLPHLPAGVELLLAGDGLQALHLPLVQHSSAAAAAAVHVLGRVADLDRFYGDVDVLALPSLSGSGAHEKSIEAIHRAPRVVATLHALRGLGSALPAHIQVADDPLDFARLCARPLASAPERDDAVVLRWSQRRQRQYQQALVQCLQALRQQAPGRASRPALEPVEQHPRDDWQDAQKTR